MLFDSLEGSYGSNVGKKPLMMALLLQAAVIVWLILPAVYAGYLRDQESSRCYDLTWIEPKANQPLFTVHESRNSSLRQKSCREFLDAKP